MNEIFNMYFRIIEDERDPINTVHPLVDILKLIMIAMLCGMDELDKVVDYGKSKKEFLEKEFNIKLIPSKSTLTRVMAMISPQWLSLSIVCILNTLIKEKANQIMIDGKAIKSTDAMHCQKETAEVIIKNKGDYVLQLKANQGNFYTDVYAMFDDKYINEADTDCEYETCSTINKGHGRIEKRTCYVLNEVEYFTDYIAEWKGLKKIFAVVREVEKDKEITKEISCYLSSKNATAEELLRYTRNHWQIESMHHILDVTYDEDRCKMLTQKAQENMNIFRKMGVSVHKKYLKDKKQTVKSNMFNCLLNDNLLLEVIGNITKT